MNLKEYLEAEDISVDEFAFKCGFNRQTVYNWIYEYHLPWKSFRKLVALITDGKVTEKDWRKNGEKKTTNNKGSAKANGVHLKQHLASSKKAVVKGSKAK